MQKIFLKSFCMSSGNYSKRSRFSMLSALQWRFLLSADIHRNRGLEPSKRVNFSKYIQNSVFVRRCTQKGYPLSRISSFLAGKKMNSWKKSKKFRLPYPTDSEMLDVVCACFYTIPTGFTVCFIGLVETWRDTEPCQMNILS